MQKFENRAREYLSQASEIFKVYPALEGFRVSKGGLTMTERQLKAFRREKQIQIWKQRKRQIIEYYKQQKAS